MPNRSPVSGVVTLGDKPLAGVSVQFVPQDETKGRSASGRTDASGNYILSTFDPNDGAIPGDYKVLVVQPLGEDKNLKDLKKGAASDVKGGEGVKIPAKYADAKTTDLKVTVKPTTNKIPLELK